jgi:phospho-N-acetylmuramoyl-pentapeptide-transferase
VLIAGVACYAIASLGREPFATSLTFPFFKELVLPLGWFFMVFGSLITVGAGNAVNLTDGLDGLAIVPVIIATLSFGFIAYLAGNTVFADYLTFIVAGTGSLRCCAGRCSGGARVPLFNAPRPRSSGDTGSPRSAVDIGTIAVATKHGSCSP